MGRIGVAFKAFFLALASREKADRVALALSDAPLPKVTVAPPAAKPEKAPPKPARSEALTLLDALQREARLVDLCQESLDAYSDEQIGAAARNVIRDSGKVLERFFALTPVAASEGTELEVPLGYDPGRYRLAGRVSGNPPYRGKVVHPGWQATRCELPQWMGSQDAAWVVAAAEVEVQ
jgi:hypothetical protein